MPEIIWIPADKNLGIAIVESKNTFLQLLIQKFPGDSCDIITNEKASAELLSLV